jgi:predicted signal transduction protein with EAL and GGDEF domain
MLTGLPNRRHFLTQLDQEMARVSRVTEHYASVLMIDVDHFKQVNDTYGHSTGDHALRHLANLMKQSLRKIDSLGRLGGEDSPSSCPARRWPRRRYTPNGCARKSRHHRCPMPAMPSPSR